MSSLTLKEQLQALSMELSVTNEKETKNISKKKDIQKESPVKSKPAWLEQAQYGVELLKVHFPNCFKDIKEIKPLKIGIKQDLVKNLSGREDIVIGDKACMVSSLSYYVNSIVYHKNIIEGANRIDLDGNSVGTVTADEAKYSLDCRQNKLQKKKSQSNPKAPIAETAK